MSEKSRMESFFETLEYTNIELSDLVDIKKIKKNIEKVQLNLNTLNYIISNNQKDLEDKIEFLYEENKNVFSILPLLIAVDKKFKFNLGGTIYDFEYVTKNLKNVIKFFNQTKLNELIIEGKIKNFVDYLTGVEVGKDTNARKNRFGAKNAKEIYKILVEEFENNSDIKITRELYLKNVLDENFKNKKLDFIIENIKNDKKVYIETSYYNKNGSKINETSKSYSNINNIFKKYEKGKFLWIVDGNGIRSIKKYLINDEKNNDFIYNKSEFLNAIKKILEI